MGSGLQDVNAAFGLNTKAGDRVLYRKSTTYAVLSLEGRTSVANLSDLNLPFAQFHTHPSDEQFLLGYFGSRPNANLSYSSETSLLLGNISSSYSVAGGASFVSDMLNASNTFQPIPDLQRQGTDLVLKVIAKNNVAYRTPVNDVIFEATVPNEAIMMPSGTSWNGYKSNFPIGVIACIQQYQFCIPGTNQTQPTCTMLSHLPGLVSEIDLVQANDLQRSIMQMLISAGYLFDVGNWRWVSASAGSNRGDMVVGLPDDQWMREAIMWESSVWAAQQIAVAQYALGPPQTKPDQSKTANVTLNAADRRLCQMQRMRKSGVFANINVFGLAFVITFSCVVTALDLCLLRFLIFLSRFRKALAPRLDRWVQDGVF